MSKRRGFMYIRISRDRKGEALGVDRQRSDCEALAKRMGVEVVDVFNDNDRTATKGLKHRPDYVRMLERVAAGEVDVVLAYSQERLWRDELEHPLFMRMAREVGVRVMCVNGGEVNPDDANDSFVSTILNAVHVMEAATVKRRVTREMIDRREAGKYMGGPRAFGHTQKRDALEPAEAALIKDAVKRVAAGESPYQILLEWNEAGVLTTTGRPWQCTPFLDLLRQPRLAGLAIVNGNKHTRKAQGIEPELVPAAWPAIVDVDLWRECGVALKVRGARKPGATPAVHLLGGGLARCGRCNSGMYSGHTGREGDQRTTYRCPAPAVNARACGRMTMKATLVERIVVDKVMAHLDTPAFAKAVRQALKANGNQRFVDLAAKLDRKQAKLREVEDMYEADELDGAAYKRHRARLVPEVAALERQVAEARGDEVIAPVHLVGRGKALATEGWELMSVEERRELLSAVVEAVVIHPPRPGVRFDPERVEVVMRY